MTRRQTIPSLRLIRSMSVNMNVPLKIPRRLRKWLLMINRRCARHPLRKAEPMQIKGPIHQRIKTIHKLNKLVSNKSEQIQDRTPWSDSNKWSTSSKSSSSTTRGCSPSANRGFKMKSKSWNTCREVLHRTLIRAKTRLAYARSWSRTHRIINKASRSYPIWNCSKKSAVTWAKTMRDYNFGSCWRRKKS